MVDLTKRGVNKRAGGKGPNRPGSDMRPFDGERADRYLRELRKSGIPILAREAANVCRATVQLKRERDPEFAAAESDAIEAHNATIEREVHRRGIVGVKVGIWWDGVRVGWKTEYSDKMLELYAKRRIKEYNPKQEINQSTHHSGGVAVGLADLSKLSAAGRKLLRELCEKEGQSVEQGLESSEPTEEE